jgi:septal ring factor EnvC (AmiA/AmiB activator)
MFEELLELYKTKAAEVEREQKEAQAMITHIAAIDKISSEMNSKQSDVELLGRLIDQVDRLSKEVADLKSQLKARQARAPAAVASAQEQGAATEGKALDNHAKSLVEIMKERPGRYTTSELVDMLGLNKTTVISVMKRAMEIDPKHVKLTQGKRRKLYLAYVSDEDGQVAQSDPSSDDEDKMRLELMAMT